MEPIEFINLAILSEEEKKIAGVLLNEYFPKIQRLIKNDISLKIHFKEYEKDGKKRKYSLNAEVISGGIKITASSWDWDFARTIHKLMKKLENEIRHKFHTEDYTRTAYKK